jgi:acyl carrier protein
MPVDSLAAVRAAIRGAARGPLPANLDESHSFVFDLGFDSLGMLRLGVMLEEQLGRPILLDGWLSSEPDPAALTIRSLCEFLRSRLEADEGRTP